MHLSLRMAIGCLAIIGAEFLVWHMRGLELPIQYVLVPVVASVCVYFAVRSKSRK